MKHDNAVEIWNWREAIYIFWNYRVGVRAACNEYGSDTLPYSLNGFQVAFDVGESNVREFG